MVGTQNCETYNFVTGEGKPSAANCNTCRPRCPNDVKKSCPAGSPSCCSAATNFSDCARPPTAEDPDVQRKCLDEKTIAVWNTQTKSYDSQICSTGHCKDGWCDLPIVVPPTIPTTPEKPSTADNPGTGACPRGSQYFAGQWDIWVTGCDPGYTRPLFGDYCICQTGAAADEGATPSALNPLGSINVVLQYLPYILLVGLLTSVMGVFKK